MDVLAMVAIGVAGGIVVGGIVAVIAIWLAVCISNRNGWN